MVSESGWCLAGLLAGFWFGPGFLFKGGNFGGDLLLNFLIFSIMLSLAGLFWWLVARLVGCKFGSGFNSTRYLSILFILVFVSGFVVVFACFWFVFGLGLVKN